MYLCTCSVLLYIPSYSKYSSTNTPRYIIYSSIPCYTAAITCPLLNASQDAYSLAVQTLPQMRWYLSMSSAPIEAKSLHLSSPSSPLVFIETRSSVVRTPLSPASLFSSHPALIPSLLFSPCTPIVLPPSTSLPLLRLQHTMSASVRHSHITLSQIRSDQMRSGPDQMRSRPRQLVQTRYLVSVSALNHTPDQDQVPACSLQRAERYTRSSTCLLHPVDEPASQPCIAYQALKHSSHLRVITTSQLPCSYATVSWHPIFRHSLFSLTNLGSRMAVLETPSSKHSPSAYLGDAVGPLRFHSLSEVSCVGCSSWVPHTPSDDLPHTSKYRSPVLQGHPQDSPYRRSRVAGCLPSTPSSHPTAPSPTGFLLSTDIQVSRSLVQVPLKPGDAPLLL